MDFRTQGFVELAARELTVGLVVVGVIVAVICGAVFWAFF